MVTITWDFERFSSIKLFLKNWRTVFLLESNAIKNVTFPEAAVQRWS